MYSKTFKNLLLRRMNIILRNRHKNGSSKGVYEVLSSGHATYTISQITAMKIRTLQSKF